MARPSDPLVRIKLLAAAEAEFVEHGLEGAKVEQITKRAGISKGAFYLHFPSKRQLFRELIEAFVARLAALTDMSMDSCSFDGDLSPDALVDHWVNMDVEIFEFLWQNRGLIRLLLEGGSGAQFRYLVDDFVERLVAKSRHFIEACVHHGHYRPDLDLDLAADFIAGAYDRLARRLVRQSQKPDFRPALEGMQNMVLFGFASDGFSETLRAQRSSTSRNAPVSGIRPAHTQAAADRALPTHSANYPNQKSARSQGRR